jgi:hypothetical protein
MTERELILRSGKCLIFAWGPPWNWWPSIERSKYHRGVSLTWLWWGWYYVPIPVAVLLIGGTLEALRLDRARGEDD